MTELLDMALSHSLATRGRPGRRSRVTDEEAAELIMAFLAEKITLRGLAVALQSRGYMTGKNSGNSTTFLAQRFFKLIKDGKFKIELV